MKPNNYRVFTFKDGETVVRASTAWMYFAAPIFGLLSCYSPWWIGAVIGSLLLAFLYGREIWRRILGVIFLCSVFLPWGWVGGWVIGYCLTMMIDAGRIHERRRKQIRALEELEDGA